MVYTLQKASDTVWGSAPASLSCSVEDLSRIAHVNLEDHDAQLPVGAKRMSADLSTPSRKLTGWRASYSCAFFLWTSSLGRRHVSSRSRELSSTQCKTASPELE